MNYLKLLSKRQMQVYNGIMSAKKRKGWKRLDPIDAVLELMIDITDLQNNSNKTDDKTDNTRITWINNLDEEFESIYNEGQNNDY